MHTHTIPKKPVYIVRGRFWWTLGLMATLYDGNNHDVARKILIKHAVHGIIPNNIKTNVQ